MWREGRDEGAWPLRCWAELSSAEAELRCQLQVAGPQEWRPRLGAGCSEGAHASRAAGEDARENARPRRGAAAAQVRFSLPAGFRLGVLSFLSVEGRGGLRAAGGEARLPGVACGLCADAGPRRAAPSLPWPALAHEPQVLSRERRARRAV